MAHPVLSALLVVSVLYPATARAQEAERGGIEYYVSEAVHDSLASHIARQREAMHTEEFFLLWRFYDVDVRGLSVIAGPGTMCDTPRLKATARFIVLNGERFRLLSDDDDAFGVSGWTPDPLNPSEERPKRCMSMHHWPYTVRFDTSGQLLDAGYEGIEPE